MSIFFFLLFWTLNVVGFVCVPFKVQLDIDNQGRFTTISNCKRQRLQCIEVVAVIIAAILLAYFVGKLSWFVGQKNEMRIIIKKTLRKRRSN